MYEEQFSKRLTELRTQKGVSARDMSLSIGQNPGYIRAIESGTAFPTMANFFYICEYFNITPQEFFNFGEETSNGMNALVDQLKQFDAEQINALTVSIEKLAQSVECMVKEQEAQGKRLVSLESKDGEMWRKVVGYVITTIIGIAVGFMFTQIGM